MRRLTDATKYLAIAVLVAGGIVSNPGSTAIAQEPAAQEPAVQAPADAAQSAERSAIRIGAGDKLEVVTYRVPELTLRTQVGSNGDVKFPLVGELKMAGLTVSEAQTKIADALVAQGYVLNPQVTIVVTEYATQGVSVLGEVSQPGIYPFFGPHRLTDVLSAAGGLTVKAGQTITLIHKADPDNKISLDIPRDLAHSPNNVEVFPGDTIIVSKAGVVYVVGEVNRPGGFLLENNMPISVLQAIALAQGFTRDGNQKEARIVRRTPTGLQEIPIQLNKLMAGDGPDRLLSPDDIVFVPASNMKILRRRFGDAAIAASSAAVYYAFH
ncbi:polysaccharide export protein [Candidatus Koribacter versatilis Ellin345]|uniref:Polysaccharide export protein n=1 Tax=Koribacter versatilis (strain Ellin345) TaxID=204669 RepID=Q1ILD8_KORVE|nr:polysaccharide biosynthesis/export family protein [Candidatus Koribacter versatilis]ABF42312.1 polysaccharide export protein [Candidatus Koribacter versatilis Ellin345]